MAQFKVGLTILLSSRCTYITEYTHTYTHMHEYNIILSAYVRVEKGYFNTDPRWRPSMESARECYAKILCTIT